jgi:hypothetical protein
MAIMVSSICARSCCSSAIIFKAFIVEAQRNAGSVQTNHGIPGGVGAVE